MDAESVRFESQGNGGYPGRLTFHVMAGSARRKSPTVATFFRVIPIEDPGANSVYTRGGYEVDLDINTTWYRQNYSYAALRCRTVMMSITLCSSWIEYTTR